jgi:cell division protein FtsB
MLDLHEWRRLRRLLYSKGALVLLLFLLLMSVQGVWDIYVKERSVNRIVEEQEQELVELQRRQAALVLELNRLSTERGIEAELRQKYEVARPGEHVIVLVEPQRNDVPTTTQKKNFFEWLQELFH